MFRNRKSSCVLAVALLTWMTMGLATASEPSGDRVPTGQGDLVTHPVSHASFVLGWNGQTIYVDPAGGAERFADLPSPSLVLITDIHGDHLDVDTLSAVLEETTRIVAPVAVAERLSEGLQSQVTVLANGDRESLLGMQVEAVPMYNLTEDRLKYHQRGRGNGYVVTLDDVRVYISGDTEDIPEMRALEDIDVALVCFNLPYTMTEAQAASAVREFAPGIVYPYHFRGSNVDAFEQLVDGASEVRVLDWY